LIVSLIRDVSIWWCRRCSFFNISVFQQHTLSHFHCGFYWFWSATAAQTSTSCANSSRWAQRSWFYRGRLNFLPYFFWIRKYL
jgi:hypothetical protein